MTRDLVRQQPLRAEGHRGQLEMRFHADRLHRHLVEVAIALIERREDPSTKSPR